MSYPQIFAEVFNTPLLVTAAKAQAFVSGFGPRLLGAAPVLQGGAESLPEGVYRRAKPFASLLDQSLTEAVRAGRQAGYAVRDGVAVIPITGVLVHRGSWIGQSSGQTSYEGISAALETAAEDSRVRGIALEIDTYGGTVSGCFGLADRIRAVAATKPVQAFVAESAFSAGYALASQASRIVVPRTGGVGSIGVVALHADWSRQLDAEGVTVTLLHAGAHKVDGNPYAPLPAEVQAKFEAEMEAVREIFVQTVALGRGSRLTAAAARETEAESYLGAEAVRLGLADELAEPRAAFEAFVADLNGRGTGASGRRAANPKGAETMPPEEDITTTEPGADTTPAGAQAGATQPAPAEGTAPAEASATNQRERIAAITRHAEAAGRSDLAEFLAFDTDLSAELSGQILAKAPKASGGQLERLMASDDTELEPAAAGGPARASLAARMKRRFA